MKTSKTANNYLKQELDDYKLKATKTLQTKDKLISQLKENAALLGNDESENATGSVSNSLKSIEIEELRSERDHFKDELNSKNVALELLRNEMMVRHSFFFLVEINLKKKNWPYIFVGLCKGIGVSDVAGNRIAQGSDKVTWGAR